MQDTDFVISCDRFIAQGIEVSPETMLNAQADQRSLDNGNDLHIRSVLCLSHAHVLLLTLEATRSASSSPSARSDR